MSWLEWYGKLVSGNTKHDTMDGKVQHNSDPFYRNASSTPYPLRKLDLPQQSGQTEDQENMEEKKVYETSIINKQLSYCDQK